MEHKVNTAKVNTNESSNNEYSNNDSNNKVDTVSNDSNNSKMGNKDILKAPEFISDKKTFATYEKDL